VDPLAGLTIEQRVGQVFMVGTSANAAEDATIEAVRDRFVGGVFLSGRGRGGTAATAAVVAQFTALTAPTMPLFVSTDQEGGEVQVLQGPGFSAMPSARDQGLMDPAALQASATTWATELASAGVNMNLAPVVDLVTLDPAGSNPPIGAFNRQFGHDAAGIVAHADAFRAGMTAAGVRSVIKHFPGLGAVTANTDDTAGVTDTATGPQSESVGIFRSEIAAGADTVMMSSAIYTQIDPGLPAVFSPTAVGLLRDDLGFDGLVITDDLSGATQVTAWSPADRAILALEAGNDIVLVSRTPTVAAEMIDAVVARAKSDAGFAELVDVAAERVLAAKGAL
jgi:beta-N-acetylhexosaminidase